MDKNPFEICDANRIIEKAFALGDSEQSVVTLMNKYSESSPSERIALFCALAAGYSSLKEMHKHMEIRYAS